MKVWASILCALVSLLKRPDVALYLLLLLALYLRPSDGLTLWVADFLDEELEDAVKLISGSRLVKTESKNSTHREPNSARRIA